MPGSYDLCLIVPCYNEERRLHLPTFASYLQAFPRHYVLFVNDGSRDDTAGLLARFIESQARAQLLDLKSNGGKAEAVRQGMLRALQTLPSSYLGYWDADLSTPLAEVPKMLAQFSPQADIAVVIGSRVNALRAALASFGACPPRCAARGRLWAHR